ncbi:MAG: TraX family protein, partial [Faecalibacillus intestinalis]
VFISFCKVVLGVDPIFDVTTDILFGNPQWMMIFSLIFILMYNDEKGRGLKWFFYIFYPLHIAVLYIISNLLISK